MHGDEDDEEEEGAYGLRRHAGSSQAYTGTAGASAHHGMTASSSQAGGLLQTHYATVGGGTADDGNMELMKPSMPADAIVPHWSHNEGFGRGSFRSLLWSLLHPRKALKSLCSIQLRLFSRLEFNDAGLIVRHEDTWGLREAIEGIIPFASVIYPLHRRIVGFLLNGALQSGFSLRHSILATPLSLLTGGGGGSGKDREDEKHDERARDGQHRLEAMYHSSTSGQSTPLARLSTYGRGDDAHAAAVALLERQGREPYTDPVSLRWRAISVNICEDQQAHTHLLPYSTAPSRARATPRRTGSAGAR